MEGANLGQAKDRIEKTMDSIVAGFEHQLDELYKMDAMNVDSDIRVMETMLRRDTASAEKDFGLGTAPPRLPSPDPGRGPGRHGCPAAGGVSRERKREGPSASEADGPFCVFGETRRESRQRAGKCRIFDVSGGLSIAGGRGCRYNDGNDEGQSGLAAGKPQECSALPGTGGSREGTLSRGRVRPRERDNTGREAGERKDRDYERFHHTETGGPGAGLPLPL